MSYDPDKVTFFAETDARGQHVQFGIKAKDRTRHMYVIGKTGMGKSTLLENMAVQDIANGEGLAFIDPHGQTAETLLDYIPEHRVKDVLYFAPFDTEHPVAFNVMEDVGPDKRHLVVSGLMSVFKKIWIDAWSARMEYILQNTLLALLEYPDSTLLGVNRMLSDKHYRKKVVDNISDPAVKSFWVDEFANYNERYMQEAGDSIKNKIGQFTANPLIRNIIGQPKSSFDLRKIMDEKKILIMNLSKGLIGESNANLLGSMLTTRIYLAAMSRADLTLQEMQRMPNFYFYVDEFQSFANATFADILSEARKYKLNLTIAHQYIEQMEEEVKNAVFGNVGTIISFRVGPFDAETLETIFSPQFLAVDICNLGFAQVYLTLMIDGIGSPPFSAKTLPPITLNSVSCRDMVLHSSREQFAFARHAVEAAINEWHEEQHQPERPKPHQASAGNNNKSESGNGRSENQRGGQPNGQSRNGEGRPQTSRPPKQGNESGDKNRSSERIAEQTSRTAAGNTQRRPQPGKKPEDQLNELRSVLQGLVSKEQTKEEPTPRTQFSESPQPTPKTPVAQSQKNTEERQKKQHEQPRTEPRTQRRQPAEIIVDTSKHKGTPEGTGNLKSALADVLSQVGTTAKENSKPISQPSAEKPATPQPEQKAPASSPGPVVSSESDPLDPKRLERMMRVNTGDNSPLR